MDNSQKWAYWMDIARYDLCTATHMWQTRRYLYVAFMCQQAIEKLLKACYVGQRSDDPPRLHDLLKLAAAVPITLPPDFRLLLARLTAYYIEGRYPNYKQKLSKLTGRAEAQALLRQARRCFRWLDSQHGH